jgi:hypothetical protein
VIQQLVAADLAAGREVVITGDFNDFSGTDTDQQGNVPTSHVLKMLQDIDGDGVDELTNLISMVPLEDRYSDWWDCPWGVTPFSCALYIPLVFSHTSKQGHEGDSSAHGQVGPLRGHHG